MPSVLRPTGPPGPLRRLLVLTLLVTLVHAALLAGLPRWVVGFHQGAEQATQSFATRTIAPEPQPAAVSAPAAPATKPAKPKAAQPKDTPKPVAPAAAPADAQATQADSAQTPGSTTGPGGDSGSSPASTDATGTSPSGAQGDAHTANAQTAAAQTGATGSAATEHPAATPTMPDATPPRKLVLPASVRLSYDVVGVVTYSYTGGSELLWLNQGSNYNARLNITKFGFSLRTWTSQGELGEQGLAPRRFGDKTRSERATHFQRDKGIVSFSSNAPDVPLQAGAQDYLSCFFQLAGMLAGEPQRYPAGTQIVFQVADASKAENWVFRVDGEEMTPLPDGPQKAVKITHEHGEQFDTKVELWLAPERGYVPVRVRLSQRNGDFAELLWRSSQKPE